MIVEDFSPPVRPGLVIGGGGACPGGGGCCANALNTHRLATALGIILRNILRELSSLMTTPRTAPPSPSKAGGVRPDAINSWCPYSMTNFLSRWTEFALGRGLRLAGILLLAIVLARLLKSLTKRLVYKPSADGASRTARMREQQTQTVSGMLHSAGVAIIIALAILMSLREFGYDVTPLAAAAGLASLAIGFGAQNLVRDLIAGIFVVFEDQYVVGDTIRIGQTTGRVEHITLRRTVLRDDQGAIVTIPNGQVQQVANLSRDWSQVLIGVTVAPDTPLEAPLAVLERMAADIRGDADWSAALVDGPRVLGVDAIGPAGAKIVLQVRTAPTRQDDVARELRRRISASFEKEAIRTTGVQRVEVQYATKEEEVHHGTSHA